MCLRDQPCRSDRKTRTASTNTENWRRRPCRDAGDELPSGWRSSRRIPRLAFFQPLFTYSARIDGVVLSKKRLPIRPHSAPGLIRLLCFGQPNTTIELQFAAKPPYNLSRSRLRRSELSRISVLLEMKRCAVLLGLGNSLAFAASVFVATVAAQPASCIGWSMRPPASVPGIVRAIGPDPAIELSTCSTGSWASRDTRNFLARRSRGRGVRCVAASQARNRALGWNGSSFAAGSDHNCE